MRIDYVEIDRAARRQRAQAIAEAVVSAIAWIASHVSRSRHAAGPHFAR